MLHNLSHSFSTPLARGPTSIASMIDAQEVDMMCRVTSIDDIDMVNPVPVDSSDQGSDSSILYESLNNSMVEFDDSPPTRRPSPILRPYPFVPLRVPREVYLRVLASNKAYTPIYPGNDAPHIPPTTPPTEPYIPFSHIARTEGSPDSFDERSLAPSSDSFTAFAKESIAQSARYSPELLLEGPPFRRYAVLWGFILTSECVEPIFTLQSFPWPLHSISSDPIPFTDLDSLITLLTPENISRFLMDDDHSMGRTSFDRIRWALEAWDGGNMTEKIRRTVDASDRSAVLEAARVVAQVLDKLNEELWNE